MPLDGWVLAAIALKTFGYAAALLAMGGALFALVFGREVRTLDLRPLLLRLTCAAALIGLAVIASRVGLRAARISGVGTEGALDPLMLSIVWDSPLGTAGAWRIAGFLIVLTLPLPRIGPAVAAVGAACLAVSFSQVGHATGEPHALLAGLVVLHTLAAAFWVGALAPLHRAAIPEGADLLHRFGTLASFAVAVLAAAGLVFGWLMTGSLTALFATPYGLTLVLKIVLVTGLLGLAALNRFRLVPALASGAPLAASALRRSIVLEMALVTAILLVTAALTTATVPPAR